jgi:hypothetical protein
MVGLESSPASPLETFGESLPARESERLLRELQGTNKALLNVIKRLEERGTGQRSTYSIIQQFLLRHSKLLLATPNLTATFLWLGMLLYFVIWYLGLPRDHKGQHPKIRDNVSLWPYISCIGEKQLALFRGVCITMAILISTSFVLLCQLGNPIALGIWLRRMSTLFAVLSSCALIALSFQSVDSAPKAHLVATSIQIFAMGNTKFFDWLSNAFIRKALRERIGAFRRVRPLEVSRWLKTCVAAFAAGMSKNLYSA